MLKEEAKFIGSELKKVLKNQRIDTVLDIGSSTKEFRTKIQPWIYEEIFSILEKEGKTITYLDQKSDEGNNKVMDIEEIDKIKEKYDLVLCFNLLEHVIKPEELSKKITKLVAKQGHLFVTVPHVYPYHPDPIDTLFRPTPKDLGELFSNMDVQKGEIILKKISFKEIELFLISLFNSTINLNLKTFLKNLSQNLPPKQVTFVHFKSRF